MLYFFGQQTSASEYGPIKIGVSSDPRARLKQVQTGSPHEVWIMGVWPDCPYTEEEIHQMFAHYRMHGEWFRPEQDLIDLIFTNCVDVHFAFFDGNP
jgi:hypothetical protein